MRISRFVLNTEKWLEQHAIYLKVLMEMKVYFEWLEKVREVSEDLEIIQSLIGRQQLCIG
jgi:hypothetical protein